MILASRACAPNLEPMATIRITPSTHVPVSQVALAGLMYADNAICFTAFGIMSGQHKKSSIARFHLFALAIESALKSLALRSGATLDECKAAGHYITKMIALSERHGSTLSKALKLRLSDDDWFKDFFLLSRYPKLGPGPLFHKNYPEMIEQLLETRCRYKLKFDGGSAKAEIGLRIRCFNESACVVPSDSSC